MTNRFLLICLIGVLTASCGQKSSIKDGVAVQMLGDGEHLSHNLVIPLSDEDLTSFDSPMAGLGPIVGGIAKFVGDIFASTTDMGKVQMSYTQPIPEIPSQYLKGVRLKRIFFYIEPKKGPRKRAWLARFINGRSNVTFNFLNRVAVRMSSTHVEDPDHYLPSFVTKNLNAKDFSPLQELFNRKDSYRDVVDLEKAKEVILLKFDNKYKDEYLRPNKYGQIYIIQTTTPFETREFLEKHPKLQGFIKRIHTLNKSLLVELEKDPVIAASFEMIMSEEADEVAELGVSLIDPCTAETCYEMAVPDVNLIPVALKGNAIRMDALINAAQVPESFKLKGFIEFEVKIKTKI